MPVSQIWCNVCSAYRSVDLDGGSDCPGCGADLSESADPRVGDSAPWHFWLVVVALALYLGWRLVQGLAALVG
ncbi:MAG: hypothetical protein HKN94_11345 [Acidimicrobiales bacterium]|nr:hypothetical protein [Acidimicrobiales bacterium]RZV46206.1 MAG: hypothetical protein EX269_07900 [Acidimicrobiales bacterium]